MKNFETAKDTQKNQMNNAASAAAQTPAGANAKLNAEQAEALRILQSGANCFLTGSAGTGKSFLLRSFIESSRSVLVTASTGIAAVRIGGLTLHSAFCIPRKIITSRDCAFDDAQWARLTRGKRYRLIHACDTLVIDEISMVRADVFKWVAGVLRAERERTGHKIQLVCCGDFHQLPPVIGSQEKTAWNTAYPDNPEGFAFQTQEWKDLNIRMISLTQVVRQRTREHAAALDLLRRGDPDGTGRNWILKNAAPKPVPNGICICATRKEADSKNEKALDKLDTPLESVPTVIDSTSDELKKLTMVVEPKLHLKAGARVMTVINDPGGRFQNGSLGTVREFIYDDDGSIMFVRVNMDDTGMDVDIAQHKWEVKLPECVDSGSEACIRYSTAGEYTQFPLRLAWACTIHKSQGATYNAANISVKRVWETGQMYVALSRCSDISRMHIEGRVSSSGKVLQNKAVIKFYEAEREKSKAAFAPAVSA
ncbi:MAG: AAA family ATPase [Pyramidobacter sp.]|nr:AAA family ATPase [Pyramidobacter sp.]